MTPQVQNSPQNQARPHNLTYRAELQFTEGKDAK